ncbi:hypothetical protein CcCBS67573_g09754 [Chytriomyces confervae]|uniref:Protein kinase domain-containing protein n=1 Tax=Chytriomyces confervae TaxID=246404 RepID=A0A507DMZ6_9FUNG|nr:hypothetical protein CcCBS67573_g09754 [Chytriomyces confervae]
MSFLYAYDIYVADILAKREDHYDFFTQEMCRLMDCVEQAIPDMEFASASSSSSPLISATSNTELLHSSPINATRPSNVATAEEETVPPPAKLLLNPLKSVMHEFPSQERSRIEVRVVRPKRANPIEKIQAWRTGAKGFFNRIMQGGHKNSASIHPTGFDRTSIPHQADVSTGGEAVENCPLQEHKPNKNALCAMNKFEAAWLKHGANNSTAIHLSTAESTGGEVMEDLTPQAPTPRKRLFKGLKKFGAAALRLFLKKDTPTNRKKDIIGFLNGSKPLPRRFSQQYKLGKAIAEGGFGVVVKATRLMDGKEVAVKFIDTERIPRYMWLPDPSSPAGDLVPPEVALLQRLQHPAVIQYLDHVVESKNYTLLITEIHGSEWTPQGPVQSSGGATLVADDDAGTQTPVDLLECIRAHHHLSEPMARKVFAQVALAIQHLHANGIVHRDIKDVNIVIDSTFKIKLIDFGCAAWLPETHYLTAFFGTVTYGSPEALQGTAYRGPEAEMWSLGVLLFTMVFGENPFTTMADTVQSHFVMPQGFALDSDSGSQPGCRNLILGLLQYFPLDRLTIEEVLEHPWMKDEVDFYRNEYRSAA